MALVFVISTVLAKSNQYLKFGGGKIYINYLFTEINY